MKLKYRMYRSSKSGYYYWQDNDTGKQRTLCTSDNQEAQRLLNAKNESWSMPATAINLQIARAYLNAADPKLVSRTWQEVMEALVALKRGTSLDIGGHFRRGRFFTRIGKYHQKQASG